MTDDKIKETVKEYQKYVYTVYGISPAEMGYIHFLDWLQNNFIITAKK